MFFCTTTDSAEHTPHPSIASVHWLARTCRSRTRPITLLYFITYPFLSSGVGMPLYSSSGYTRFKIAEDLFVKAVHWTSMSNEARIPCSSSV